MGRGRRNIPTSLRSFTCCRTLSLTTKTTEDGRAGPDLSPNRWWKKKHLDRRTDRDAGTMSSCSCAVPLRCTTHCAVHATRTKFRVSSPISDTRRNRSTNFRTTEKQTVVHHESFIKKKKIKCTLY